jgi:hypothetical protein
MLITLWGYTRRIQSDTTIALEVYCSFDSEFRRQNLLQFYVGSLHVTVEIPRTKVLKVDRNTQKAF